MKMVKQYAVLKNPNFEEKTYEELALINAWEDDKPEGALEYHNEFIMVGGWKQVEPKPEEAPKQAKKTEKKAQKEG